MDHIGCCRTAFFDFRELTQQIGAAESQVGAIMRIISIAALFALPVLMPSSSYASGGGLNSEGCHTNRKTGDYHCHRGGSSQRSQSTYGLTSKPRSGGSVYYANCSAARAAGAAPVRVGDPGYAAHLDRDNDGVGCE